jgi:aquaporin Z
MPSAISPGAILIPPSPSGSLPFFPYIVAQVIGAIIASAGLYAIASGTADFSLAKGFAANGYGDHSPGKYSLVACLIAEVVLT